MATLKAREIEALGEGTHRIAPRLYLRREDRKSGPHRIVLLRWMQDGSAKVRSLGRWSRDRLGAFLAEAELAAKAQLARNDVMLAIEEADAPSTFEQAAERYMEANLGSFRHPKSRRQWRSSIEALYPEIGHLKIEQLQIGHIAKVLAPLWLRAPVKARYVRRRIEQVISYGISRNNLGIGNVASLDVVRHRLPKQPRRHPVPRRALPYSQVPACFAALGERWLPTHECLRFAMLTAMRSSECRLAKWSEIDFEQAVWTCPAERTKMGRPHRTPLSEPALRLLERLHEVRQGAFVFPGRYEGQPLSPNVLGQAMARAGFGDKGSPHGLRSSFKDYCREQTSFAWEAVEQCLAHDIQGDVERHYGRSDLLHLRVPIMAAWGDFVSGKGRGKLKLVV